MYLCTSCNNYFNLDKMKVGSKCKCKKCNNKEKKEYWSKLSYDEKRKRSLKKYNLSLEDFERMWFQYKGRCGICSIYLTMSTGRKLRKDRVCVDHCHTTGNIRGLLCANCNAAIGMFKDDTVVLGKAIEYLEKNNG